MKKRFSEEQIIKVLAEAEHGKDSIRDVCRRHNLTKQTFFRER
jgi:putative transposase